jgi:hypothetical protein
MKRTRVAATAAALLLLAGCATGDTGHLDPEIQPDIIVPAPQRTPQPDSGDEGDGGEGSETPAPGTSAAPASDLEAAFATAAGQEDWYGDVTGVDTDDDTVLVTTDLLPGDEAAVEVCEAAFDAAETTGLAAPNVLVRDADGETIAQRDTAAGDEGCSGAS